jgi:hypothetical protein
MTLCTEVLRHIAFVSYGASLHKIIQESLYEESRYHPPHISACVAKVSFHPGALLPQCHVDRGTVAHTLPQSTSTLSHPSWSFVFGRPAYKRVV